jgi:hypothetical protein
MKDRGSAGSQRFRHETQLDKWPHSDREQEIKNLIGVEKGEKETVASAGDHAHIVAQQTVKANVLETKLRMAAAQLRLPVGTKGQGGVATADGVFPGMRQCADDLRRIAAKMSLFHGGLRFHGSWGLVFSPNKLHNLWDQFGWHDHDGMIFSRERSFNLGSLFISR